MRPSKSAGPEARRPRRRGSANRGPQPGFSASADLHVRNVDVGTDAKPSHSLYASGETFPEHPPGPRPEGEADSLAPGLRPTLATYGKTGSDR